MINSTPENMLNTVSFILEIIGVILVVMGYRTSNRNLMLLAAVLLWFGGSFSDFAHGLVDGFRAAL